MKITFKPSPLMIVIAVGMFVLLTLSGVLAWNTYQMPSLQPPASKAIIAPVLQPESAIRRFSQALSVPTISWQNPAVDASPTFDRLHTQLQQGFPEIYRQLKPERIGNSLLIRWPGSNKALKPTLFAAHLDVVPVENRDSWQKAPFSGARSGGYIWGRGSLDDKNSAMALLEALETRLKTGRPPKRTIYLAFGSDEEIGGKGAQSIARRLKSQRVRLGAVLDEGMVIVPGSMIGLKPPVALIGIAEKGYLTLEIKAEQAGGHASMPPQETAVDLLGIALQRLRSQPLPARIQGPAAELFNWLGPEMPLLRRVAIANRWLTDPLLLNQLAAKPSTNALIRTSFAPTMLSASPKENVLAAQARAVINLRVLPGDSAEAIMNHFRRAIDDERVKIRQISPSATAKASRVSRTDSEFFGQLTRSVKEVFPQALIAPTLVLAATDSRHYEPIADDIYRFQPVMLSEKDLDRIHGRNERISEMGYLRMIQYYQHLMGKL